MIVLELSCLRWFTPHPYLVLQAYPQIWALAQMPNIQMPIRKLKSSHYSEIKYFNTVSQTIIKAASFITGRKKA